MNIELNKALKAALKGEAKLDTAKAAFWAAHIAPLQNAQGVIDWKAGQAKAVRADIMATVSAWFVSETRHLDGVDYDPAALKAAISKTGTAHPARDAALSGIRVKAWRWTEGLHKAESAKVAKANGATESKAASGKVSLGQKRSKAAKGKAKAATAKAAATPASVPMLSEALRDAIAKLKPQSRIVAANLVMDYMRNIISEARAAMDTAPRKAAKASKAAKAVAPAPAAVQ